MRPCSRLRRWLSAIAEKSSPINSAKLSGGMPSRWMRSARATNQALPASVETQFDGAAASFQSSLASSRAPIQALVRAFEMQGVALSEATARKDMGRAKVDHVRALLAEPDVAAAWTAAGHPIPDETHVAAIMADPGRARGLAGVTAPTLVVHGKADPLVPFACGEDTARRIPGASLVAVDGMGHDLPLALLPRL